MLKVRIEKEPEKDWIQQLRETIEAQPITKKRSDQEAKKRE